MVAVRLTRTTSILRLLAAPGDILTGEQHGLPAILALRTTQTARGILVNKELAALDTDTSQDLEDDLVELDVVNRAGESVVAEVTRALVIVQTTGATQLAILQYAHTWVREAANLAFLRIVSRYLHDGSSFDLIGAEYAELDAHNGLRL